MRFHSTNEWALVPGPKSLRGPVSSQDVQHFESLPVSAIAESLLAFSDMKLIKRPEPSWRDWRARRESGNDYVEIAMTTMDDQQVWGGSALSADCRAESVAELLTHLQARHQGVWLQDPDTVLHTADSFRLRFYT